MKRNSLIIVTVATWCRLCHAKSTPRPSSTSSLSPSTSSSLSRPKSRAQVGKSKRRRRSSNESSNIGSSSSSATGHSSTAASSAAALDRDILDLDLDDDFDLESLTANLDDEFDSVFGGNGVGGNSATGASNSNTASQSYDLNRGDQSDFDFESDFLLDEVGTGPTSEMMAGGPDSDSDVEEEYGQGTEKGALYDAYNLLHTLAQVSICTLRHSIR